MKSPGPPDDSAGRQEIVLGWKKRREQEKKRIEDAGFVSINSAIETACAISGSSADEVWLTFRNLLRSAELTAYFFVGTQPHPITPETWMSLSNAQPSGKVIIDFGLDAWSDTVSATYLAVKTKGRSFPASDRPIKAQAFEAFIEGRSLVELQRSARIEAKSRSPRKPPGPFPAELNRVKEAMRSVDRTRLESMKIEEMAVFFKATKSTVRNARKSLLLQLQR